VQPHAFADLGVRHVAIMFRPGLNRQTTEDFGRVLPLLK
jgi:hypothetical protein